MVTAPEELRVQVAAAPWRYATTYAQTAPHWYVLREQAPAMVDWVLALLRAEGYDRTWRDGRTYRYLDLDGWKYWYLPPVLNRERLVGLVR